MSLAYFNPSESMSKVFFAAGKSFLVLFLNLWQAGWCALPEKKNEGLLTGNGDLTTGLVVIAAESCPWLPDKIRQIISQFAPLAVCQLMRDDVLPAGTALL